MAINIIVRFGGFSGTLDIDTALSNISENPVQNKVITNKLDSLELISEYAKGYADMMYNERGNLIKGFLGNRAINFSTKKIEHVTESIYSISLPIPVRGNNISSNAKEWADSIKWAAWVALDSNFVPVRTGKKNTYEYKDGEEYVIFNFAVQNRIAYYGDTIYGEKYNHAGVISSQLVSLSSDVKIDFDLNLLTIPSGFAFSSAPTSFLYKGAEIDFSKYANNSFSIFINRDTKDIYIQNSIEFDNSNYDYYIGSVWADIGKCYGFANDPTIIKGGGVVTERTAQVGALVLGNMYINTNNMTIRVTGTNARVYSFDGREYKIQNIDTLIDIPTTNIVAIVVSNKGILTVKGISSVSINDIIISYYYNKSVYTAQNKEFIYIDNQLESGFVKQNFMTFLPEKIYFPIGRDFWIYRASSIYNWESRVIDYRWMVTGNSVQSTKKCSVNGYDFTRAIVSMSNSDIEYNCCIRLYNQKKYIELSNRNIKFIPCSIKTNRTIQMIVIGDSFATYKYGDGLLRYIDDFAKSDNNTIIFKGTREVANYTNAQGVKYKGETRGGWSEIDYATRYIPIAQQNPSAPTESKLMPSPFVFSDSDKVEDAYFSFSRYINTYNLGEIDVIVISLGKNTGNNGESIDSMISNIRYTHPNIKIFVCMQMKADTSNLYPYTIEDTNLQYIRRFQNREEENIFLVPLTASIHPYIGAGTQDIELAQFTDVEDHTGLLTGVVNRDIHPSPLGSKLYAYYIYNTILCHI